VKARLRGLILTATVALLWLAAALKVEMLVSRENRQVPWQAILGLAAIEILIGVAILNRRWRPTASLVGGFGFLGATVVGVVGLWSGKPAACACLGRVDLGLMDGAWLRLGIVCGLALLVGRGFGGVSKTG